MVAWRMVRVLLRSKLGVRRPCWRVRLGGFFWIAGLQEHRRGTVAIRNGVVTRGKCRKSQVAILNETLPSSTSLNTTPTIADS